MIEGKVRCHIRLWISSAGAFADLLFRDRGYLSPVSPGPYGIVSHPPKIAAGWCSLGRDGAWASPRMVLNRYKKIPGFTDEDIERATRCKVLWKVPNAFQAISPAIDHGTPVVLQEGQEVSRSFRALAAALADASPTAEGGLDLVYAQEKTESKKKSPSRLVVSPARAGQ
ncbi:MAG: hypothetical protein WCA49_05145 [Candidatus Sulfotelmatobacter sp.]